MVVERPAGVLASPHREESRCDRGPFQRRTTFKGGYPRGLGSLSRAPTGAWIPIGCIVTVSLLVSARPIRDSDTLWHVRVGELIWTTRSLLPTDPFSYSYARAPWPFKDIVPEVLFYAGHALWGPSWFVVVKVLALCAMGLCFYLFGCKGRRSWGAQVAVALVALTTSVPVRPSLFSLVGFAVLLTLVERARVDAGATGPRHLVRLVGPIVLLQWVWSELHRFALAGDFVVGAFAAYLLLVRLTAKGPRTTAVLGPRPSSRVVVATFAGRFSALSRRWSTSTGCRFFSG